MTSASYQNGVLYISFEDGDFFITSCDKDVAMEIFIMIKEGEDKESILSLIDVDYSTKVKEKKEAEEYNKVFEQLNDDKFYIEDNKLYRVGIPLSIPQALAEKIKDAIVTQDGEAINKLEKFWAWCSRMKNAVSREGFYTFIEKNNLIITSQGFVVGFRKVRSVNTDNDLMQFVVETYAKQKKYKKSINIPVFNDYGEYNIKGVGEELGLLSKLHSDILEGKHSYFESSSINHFTGKYEKYYLGKETRLPDNQVDWNPHNECSMGLHGHLGNYSDGSFGNTRIYFVVNPMDIAACPYQDYSKFRMSALTPIGIMKPGESMKDFVLTPEMDEYIGELVQNHIARLEEDINSEEYKEHTIMKEVPNVDFTGYMKTIKEIATNIAKVRYTKL